MLGRSRTPMLVVVLLLAVAPAAVLLAGPDEELKKRQSELLKIRKEIDLFEEKIKESERRETATLEQLDNHDRQAALLKKLIASLREDERKIQRDIEETRRTIAELGAQVRFLKSHYANYARSAYKYGRTYDIELLLTSRSINQLYLRSQYLQKFSEQRKRDLTKLETKRKTLEDENLILQAQLTKERQLIDEKSREETRLRARMEQRKKLLADIRKNKRNYQREIDRRREAAKELEALIARLIEEERLRKEREAAALAREGKAPPVDASAAIGVFESKRGRLRWPVNQGKLTGRFGNHQHPVLKTVTQNTGIDITVPAGSDVYAVADGEVSTIWWLPSFGNLVIVNHHDGFRTVYAHLSEIEVREGEKVTEGTRLGKSGESLSGPMIHFEVWKYRDKQDPELWLRPQGLTQR